MPQLDLVDVFLSHPKSIQNIPVPKVGISHSLWPAFSLWLLIFTREVSSQVWIQSVFCKFSWLLFVPCWKKRRHLASAVCVVSFSCWWMCLLFCFSSVQSKCLSHTFLSGGVCGTSLPCFLASLSNLLLPEMWQHWILLQPRLC